MLDESYPEVFRAICGKVVDAGWKRVILLGEDQQLGPYTLKACLAQAGVMVFVPGPQGRAWMSRLAQQPSEGDGEREEQVARFGALLRDGMEHGVDALVVTDSALGRLARTVMPHVAQLEVLEG